MNDISSLPLQYPLPEIQISMETVPRQLRKLQGPQAIQKSAPNHHLSRKTACQACYDRKKRCIPAPPHRRCKYCLHENQKCVSRERLNRVETEVKPRKNKSEIPLNAFNLRMPRGIDHEIPRWSAAYSMFTEVLKLIPPEEHSPSQQDDASSSDTENNQSGQSISDKTRNDQAVSSELKEQDNVVDSSKTTEESCNLHSSERTRSNDISPLDKEFHLSSSKHFHEGFTMYDMDALLRF